MIKDIRIKILIYVILVFLLFFQFVTIALALFKDYYLIHDWIFYCSNYLMIILVFMTLNGKRFIAIKGILFVALLVINTTFFYYLGNTNVVISESPSKEYKVILKEYKNMKFETIRLKPRWKIYGKKVETLEGSSQYKTLKNRTYRIDWSENDIATIIYKADKDGTMMESVVEFRPTDMISYYSVYGAINGKWLEKDNPKNYLLIDTNKLVYEKDGKLYYYDPSNVEQQGILSLIIPGNNEKPTLNVMLNKDCKIVNGCIIDKGGTITVSEVTLENSQGKVFYRK